MKKNKLAIALGLTASVGLVGCGGGSGSDADTSKPAGNSSYSVTAIDGYLRGAQVWLDLNGNFQLDAGEPTALSGEGGKANLNIDGIDNPSQYSVVVRAIKGETVDEDTGNAVASDYVMSAPAGQQDITPLSTLVHVQLESGQANDIETAVQNVAQQLGIEEDAVLSDYKEENHVEAAFGARSIVASGVLPENSEELQTAANDTDGTNELLETVSTINQAIKTVIEDDTKNLDDVVFNKAGEADIDSDKDGVADSDDAFKDDSENWSDFDQDGLGDQTLDDDDDNDGHNDEDDALPYNPNEHLDSDFDGKGDVADLDDDNDGVLDIDDAFDFDPTESVDTDGDGTGNNADSDDDNDGVADEDDAFDLDPNESVDSDNDGIGNNADSDDDNDGVSDDEDAFDLDPSESVDTDNDGIGNNADNDDDNDGVADEDDAFDLDPNESVDSDNDGIGNNADSDDDNDGVSDDDDAFDLDPNESVDSDGDGIGNNADNDDDNDGVEDELDVDPTNPEVGTSDIAEVISFLQSSGSFYSPWDDEEENIDQIYLQTFTVNGNTAASTLLQRVKSDGSLITIPAEQEADFQLTASGWTEIVENYTLDLSSQTELTAYPTSHPTLTYRASGSVLDLAGKKISEESFDSDLIADQTALFPEGAKAAILNFAPTNDTYYLWTNWTPYVYRGHSSAEEAHATTLDEVQVATSIGAVGTASEFVGTSIGWDISVELVTDKSAHYYTMDWSNNQATRVASATWSLETIHGVEFILFTVPEAAQTAWGDKYDQDSSSSLFSVLNGKLHMGSLMKAGEQEHEDEAVFLNAIAKDALLNVVDVPVSKCSLGNDDDGSASMDQFATAIAECGGLEPITSAMVVDKNFHRVKGNGETRDYFFNADNTVTVTKDTGDSYTHNWAIEGDYLVISYPENGYTWYWGLVEQADNRWSVKFYETETTAQAGAEQWIWADTLELSSNATCTFTEEQNSSLDAFKAKIAQYSECSGGIPSVSEQEVFNQTITRFRSNGETRSYQFNDDYSAFDYRNGLPRNRTWELSNDGMMVIYYDEAKTQVADYMVLLNDANDALTFGFYEPEENEIWTSTYLSKEVLPEVSACGIGDTQWDDVNDKPITMASKQDYLDAVLACQDNNKAYFSTEYFDRDMTFTSVSTGENDGFETFQFNALADGESQGTGKYLTAEDNMDMTWSVDDATRLVTITLTDGVNSGTDTLAIVASNGVEFSLKGLSRSTDWDGIDESSNGDIWSHVFSVSAAK